MKYLYISILLISFGCAEPPQKEPIASNHNVPIREGEVQLIIEPEFDHYLLGETIWLKVTIHNNTDKDFYITYLPDKFSVPLKIESNNGNEHIRLREIDERNGASDSVKVAPHSSFISLINLTESYFDQRHVTMGIYDINGVYDKYTPMRYGYLSYQGERIKIDYPPPLKANPIKIEILPAKGREEMISNVIFNPMQGFKSIFEKLEYLVKYHPESKYYPQIYSEYIYYLTAQSDSTKLFSNVNYFLDNIATYETILVLHRVSGFLRNKLNWDYTKRRDYFFSLKEKYSTGKVAECIDVKLTMDEYYRRANERLENWR